MIRVVIVFISFCLTGCTPKTPITTPEGMEQAVHPKQELTRVHVVDNSNLAETITNKERLKDFAQKDYLGSQPYKKIVRFFEKDKDGACRSIITSYYENGQIRQYLECLNGRACGLYAEWYSSGKRKAMSHVVAGQADLSENSPLTWSLDKTSEAWDEEGNLIARVCYEKGKLHGTSETFYPSGAKERVSFFEKGDLEGKDTLYSEDGTPLEEVTYLHGKRDGPSIGMHKGGVPAWKEEYDTNRLISGSYFSSEGKVLSTVKDGAGTRSLFDDGILTSQQEIQAGFPQGKVTLFEKDGSVEREYSVRNGKKDGRETRFFQGPDKKQRLQIEWKDGAVQGTTKTWYPNGSLESQKEMRANAKHGLSMAWYPDGSIMLVEEYDNDNLRKGRYHKRDEDTPVSQVNEGEGVVTIFDENGTVIEKVTYHEGKPLVSN